MALWPVGFVVPTICLYGFVVPTTWQYGQYVFLGRCWPPHVMADISPYGRRPGAPSRLRPSLRSGHRERRHTGPLGRHCSAPCGVLASTGPPTGESDRSLGPRFGVMAMGQDFGVEADIRSALSTLSISISISMGYNFCLWGYFWNIIFCVTDSAMSDARTVSAGAL